ncbi:hypothetical protein DVH24_018312 [Malus domestica]|uniref:Uncharacterized protein n=1 Tax=Malus domestica TaxID=3750 RepID=A0A498KD48_MALDO|nr:hypothetical protein DVH24_018312 [Malus domestica]
MTVIYDLRDSTFNTISTRFPLFQSEFDLQRTLLGFWSFEIRGFQRFEAAISNIGASSSEPTFTSPRPCVKREHSALIAEEAMILLIQRYPFMSVQSYKLKTNIILLRRANVGEAFLHCWHLRTESVREKQV